MVLNHFHIRWADNFYASSNDIFQVIISFIPKLNIYKI